MSVTILATTKDLTNATSTIATIKSSLSGKNVKFLLIYPKE